MTAFKKGSSVRVKYPLALFKDKKGVVLSCDDETIEVKIETWPIPILYQSWELELVEEAHNG